MGYRTDELDDTDEAILDRLRDGRNRPTNIAEHIDRSRQFVHGRLKTLAADDYVERVDRGIYELGPAAKRDGDDADCREAVLNARRALEEATDAMESNDDHTARQHVEQALTTLNEADV